MAARTSIRVTLLVVLGVLNFLIVVMLGYGVVRSYENYRNAQSLIESADILNPLFTSQKHLAEERTWSISSIYITNANKQKYKDALSQSRQDVDNDIKGALQIIRDRQIRNVTLPMSKVESDYAKLLDMRKKMDRYLAQPQKQPRKQAEIDKNYLRANETANDIVVATTSLVTSIRQLRSDYSRQLSALTPSAWSQMQLSSIVGEVTEYANREYTVLAKLIAENQYPDEALQEQLALWRGRISYGWDMMRSAAAGNDWTSKALPIIENAENDYFSMFDEIKTVFNPSRQQKNPGYGLSVEAWIGLASQTVDSIYAMNQLVMDVGSDYRRQVQRDARWSIIVSVFFFILSLSVSLYLWHMFVVRVINPLDTMVDSLYKTVHGETAKIPNFQHSPQEILKLAKVLKTLQSYSDQLQVERDNAHAANRAKSDFLANISHELRTPMNVVLGLIDILMRTDKVTPRQRELMASLDESAKSLLYIINDLLDFSEFESSSVKLEQAPINLKSMLDDIQDKMKGEADAKGLRSDLVMNDIPDILHVGDQVRVRQILVNLYANAIKFTNQGFVRLEISCASGKNETDVMTFRVTDSGIGIAKEEHERIFEKFTQVHASNNRKYGGTGLGLAISKTLAEMMGGEISVDSEEGKGSSFIVRIPFKRHIDQPEFAVDRTPANDVFRKVLLVEDYAPNILVATKYLEDLGYTCDVAETGSDAFEKYQNSQYDAILLDIKLTDMMGYDVAKAIRGYEEQMGRPRSLIIGVTAYAGSRDQQQCLDAGMDDCLLKPYTIEQLSEKIDKSTRSNLPQMRSESV